ncbi:hypothetical protein [Streptomyces sp. NPDC127108]|uniref:hypothetical protein n=1 Tax=Streptomyces sp. NPDC127108 TaxID=3345361 RepID=UPI0036400F6E
MDSTANSYTLSQLKPSWSGDGVGPDHHEGCTSAPDGRHWAAITAGVVTAAGRQTSSVDASDQDVIETPQFDFPASRECLAGGTRRRYIRFMSTSVSSLIIAVVGVLGTLFSGLLAHRSSVNSKKMELRHVAEMAHAEREENRRQSELETRRSIYGELNAALRDYYAGLRLTLLALQKGDATEELRVAVGGLRDDIRGVYAKGQMFMPDDVLDVVGNLVALLHHLYNNLVLHCAGQDAEESLEVIAGRLSRASEVLYEVRQTMRKDLGLTSSDVNRPSNYGVFN